MHKIETPTFCTLSASKHFGKPFLMRLRSRTHNAAIVALLAAACFSTGEVSAANTNHAVATVRGASAIKATVHFRQTDKGVETTVDATGLPGKEHAIHIHEFGDCSAGDFMSAGPHFNPKGHKHGGPDASERHAGDLGNLAPDSNGAVQRVMIDQEIQLEGPNTIIGRAVVIHEKADDLKSDPAGNAGARIACGVIGIAK